MEETEELAEVEAQETVEEVAPTLSFTSLGTKGLSASAKHVAWSSAMDLVVLVSQENTIALHRLNWQRIWSVTETREVTALAWKSDGKSVVTGFEDGHYTIWDIENGAVRFSTVKHGTSNHGSRAAVTHLSWSLQGDSTNAIGRRRVSKYADTGRSKLATLWPLQGVDAPLGGLFSSSTMEADQSALDKQAFVGDSSTTRLERSEPSILDILVVGHSDGHVHLYALGTFQIGSVDMESHLRASKPTLKFGSVGLISTTMSSDFSSLHVVAQLRAKDDSIKFDEQGGEVGPDGSTVLTVIDTGALAKRNPELLAVVWQCTLVQDLYYRIAALTEKMALLWSDAITPFVTKMKLFAEKLELENSSLESALLALLTQGVQSTMLETLLVVNLGAKNTEIIMRTIQTTCDTLEHLVSQHLRPTTERLMYRLVLLNSFAKHKRLFSEIGLSEKPIVDMMQSAQGMISLSANFVLHLSRSRQLYTSFLTWIHQYTIDASDRDQDAIEESLMAQQRNLPHTSIQQLVSQMLSSDMLKQDILGELIRGRISPVGPAVASTRPVAGLFGSASNTSVKAATGLLLSTTASQQAFNAPGTTSALGRQLSGATSATSSTFSTATATTSLQQPQRTTSATSLVSSTSSSHQKEPQRVVYLDESAGLGMDESLDYGANMSMDESQDGMVREGSISMALDDSTGVGGSGGLFTPNKLTFQPPMTSSPEASNMGPITLIDLPSHFGLSEDHSLDTSFPATPLNLTQRLQAPATATYKNPLASQNFSFSGLRTSVHQQAEQVFHSISKHLSTSYTTSSALVLFTRSELLSDVLTEVFPMKDFAKIMQDEHAFQFYTDSGLVYLLFKDSASLWVLKMTSTESFGVSGIEISSLHTEEIEETEEELFLDFKYYKENHVMALIKTLEGPKSCQVQKLNLAELQFYPTKVDVANASNGMINYFDDIVMMHPFQHTSEECSTAQRDFAGFDVLSLALSGPRGVGLVLGAPRKCMLLDFESDETPEEPVVEEETE